MAVYVAYEDKEESPARLASVSFVALKNKIRARPGRWAIATYRTNWTQDVVCQAIEDVSEVEADNLRWYRVSVKGKVRQEK